LDLANADLLVDARALLGGGLRGSDGATNGTFLLGGCDGAADIHVRVGAKIRNAHLATQKIGSFRL
jgi:hypothetical protein